jgi:hypothetical protein
MESGRRRSPHAPLVREWRHGRAAVRGGDWREGESLKDRHRKAFVGQMPRARFRCTDACTRTGFMHRSGAGCRDRRDARGMHDAKVVRFFPSFQNVRENAAAQRERIAQVVPQLH